MSGGRVLVAGLGNVLRGDDGFGIAVVEALGRHRLPDGVRAVEVGINGISLVHELMAGWQRLILIDAIDRGGAPGTLWVLEPEFSDSAVAFEACDMHEMVPARILTLSRAVGVLPPWVRVIGCQPAETETFSLELTAAVQAAVERAVREVLQWVDAEPQHAKGRCQA